MDHESAIRTGAVERYQLGEMDGPEREAFEEHYFSCPICAEAVRTAEALIEDIKEALRNGEPKSARRWWFAMPAMIPMAAALALAAVVVYQNAVVLPALEAPRTIGPALILDGVTRGAGPKIQAGSSLHVEMGLDGVTASRLRVEIEREAGGTAASGLVAAPAAKQPLDVYFPEKLGPGRYVMVVRENPGGKEIARSSFEVVEESRTK